MLHFSPLTTHLLLSTAYLTGSCQICAWLTSQHSRYPVRCCSFSPLKLLHHLRALVCLVAEIPSPTMAPQSYNCETMYSRQSISYTESDMMAAPQSPVYRSMARGGTPENQAISAPFDEGSPLFVSQSSSSESDESGVRCQAEFGDIQVRCITH